MSVRTSKLSEREIERRYRKGEAGTSIARAAGVSGERVYQILRKRIQPWPPRLCQGCTTRLKNGVGDANECFRCKSQRLAGEAREAYEARRKPCWCDGCLRRAWFWEKKGFWTCSSHVTIWRYRNEPAFRKAHIRRCYERHKERFRTDPKYRRKWIAYHRKYQREHPR